MSELALKLIKEAKEKRLTRLDLGNCGLTELPDELFELVWLEELMLCAEGGFFDFNKNEWFRFKTRNDGKPNNIKNFLSKKKGKQQLLLEKDNPFKHLSNLKILLVNGPSPFLQKEKWALCDLYPLEVLKQLEVIDVSSTQVERIDIFEDLKLLQQISIGHTQVRNLGALKNLTKLQGIQADNTQIDNLDPIKKLTQLKWIDIRGTKVDNLSMLRKFTKLKFLFIKGTPVNDLSLLRGLTQLERLDVSKTRINDLSPLKYLVLLRQLNISSTNVNDLSSLQNLSKLRLLDISRTNVSDLNPLKDLIHLFEIRAFSTKIKDLSPLKKIIEQGRPVKLLEGYNGIEVKDCPITNPPLVVVEQGNGAILRYWQELENKETQTNNQTKLIFIGNSRAGKTSLWQFLKDKIYKEQADSTHGIKTEIWDTETLGTEDKQNLAAHIWDFGGQEYYHATHRLFLADNAVYVLVWEKESNKQGTRLETFKLDDDPNGEIEEVDIEHFPASYWWESIQYFAGVHCPVLIVQNKVDSKSDFSPHTKGVSETADCFHLSIKNAFERFNLGKTDHAFEKFKETLLELLRKNATAFKLVNYYAQVRKALEAKAKDTEYIAVSELKDIALQFDETPDLENLLAYLKSFTNTVLYFPQNEVLKDRLYLNPTHISRDIYKILNKTVRENNGKFDRTHIQTRLNCDAPEAERFVALMKEFDLVFEKEEADKGQVFIAPQYLKEKDKLGVNIAMFSKQLKLKPAFYIRFAIFVPRSMMSRFIAHNGQFTTDETYWKNGLIYGSKETDASIKVEYTPETRTFCIDVQNVEQQAVDMQNIVAQFVKLNGSDDKIELSNDGKNYIELQIIRKLQHENRRGDIYDKGALIPLTEFDWLIQKQKMKERMHIKELKDKVRNFISNDKTQEAINEVSQWAHRNNDEEIKDNLSQLSGQLSKLKKDNILGVLSDSDATTKQNQINNRVLNLLQSLTDPVSEPVETITINPSIIAIMPNNNKPKIYFSYAWTDKEEKKAGENREQIVTDLYDSLKADGYDVRRDKENVGYKESISEFMKEIGWADFIVVAISKKYLESANCMFEMLQIYRKSNSDLDKLKEKIYPIVLEGTKIYDPLDRLKYVRFWKDKKETLEKEINEIGLAETIAIIGNDYRNYKEINDNIALISSLIADLNTLSPEVLSQDNFEEIKKSIKARGGIANPISNPIEANKPVNTTDTPQTTLSVDSKQKEMILSLIDEDMDKVLEELDKIFMHKNSTYMDLLREYINRPNNFSMSNFRSKLKRFVNMNL